MRLIADMKHECHNFIIMNLMCRLIGIDSFRWIFKLSNQAFANVSHRRHKRMCEQSVFERWTMYRWCEHVHVQLYVSMEWNQMCKHKWGEVPTRSYIEACPMIAKNFQQ